MEKPKEVEDMALKIRMFNDHIIEEVDAIKAILKTLRDKHNDKEEIINRHDPEDDWQEDLVGSTPKKGIDIGEPGFYMDDNSGEITME